MNDLLTLCSTEHFRNGKGASSSSKDGEDAGEEKKTEGALRQHVRRREPRKEESLRNSQRGDGTTGSGSFEY